MNRDGLRIVSLGGCGGMGQFAVRTALTFDFVREIVVADLDGERALRFAASCGPKVRGIQLDVQDSARLAQVFERTDLVLATVGPYYRFGVPILQAAIRARCHYIDINDDWEPTLEMLDMDEEARKAGITAVVGMGASPGVSNLLAVKAIGLLDKVHTVITGWGSRDDGESGGMPEPGEGGTYGAAIDHWLHQLTGEIRLWRDGTYADVRPLQAVEVDYPGIGRAVTHTVGHPEPVTLPRYFPQIRESCNVMGFPASTIAVLRWLVKRVEDGELSFSEATDWLTSLAQGGDQERLLADAPPELIQVLTASAGADEPLLPPLFAVATGMREGLPASAAATVSSTPSGSMGAITGIPVAIGLRMIAEGKIERRGVFAPEAVVDPDAFFDALAPFCEPRRTNHEDMLIITTAP